MTNFKKTFFWIASILVILSSACNDPTDIGSELVAGEFSDIRFTDTISVTTLTTNQDSIFTYDPDPLSQYGTYLIGYIDEPIFGKAKASVYVDFRLQTTSVVSDIGFLEFDNVVFDSLVLSMAYDSTRYYGDTLIPQTFKVYRMLEQMQNDIPHYSDESYDTELIPIGELTFDPKPSTLVYNADSTVLTPRIRIPLSDALGQEFMSYDTTTYSSSEDFQMLFNGIKIETDDINSNILGMNLKSNSTYLRLFYTVNDTIHTSFTYVIGDLSTKINIFEHDNTGSISEPFVNNQSLSDSLIFTQGMSGSHVKVDFPYIQSLNNVIVNEAELEFTYAYLPGDDTISYPPPFRAVLTKRSDNGDFVFIDDVNSAVLLQNLDLFGGAPEYQLDNGMYVKKYTMTISNYIQDIIDGNLDDNSVYLQIYLKNQYANRGVFYGGEHSLYPVKLNLTYTQL